VNHVKDPEVGNFSLVGKHLAIGVKRMKFHVTLALRGISNRYNQELSYIAHTEL
jgi:hypothetical protein